MRDMSRISASSVPNAASSSVGWGMCRMRCRRRLPRNCGSAWSVCLSFLSLNAAQSMRTSATRFSSRFSTLCTPRRVRCSKPSHPRTGGTSTYRTESTNRCSSTSTTGTW
eukprot:09423_3